MLDMLFELATQPYNYRHEPKLSFVKIMRCAILYNRVDVLERAGKLKMLDPAWQWEPVLMDLALKRDDPDLQVVEWLYAHLPREAYPIAGRHMMYHATRGNLSVVRWLHGCGITISPEAMTEAAKGGHVHVLRYFYEHSTRRCPWIGMESAAERGHLDVVKFFVTNPRMCWGGVCAAAKFGQLEVVKYLVENNPGCKVSMAMNAAAERGQLDTFKYLYEARPGECSPQAMRDAAAFGRLNVVKFLLQNGMEGWIPDAFDHAAEKGHLDIVKFLHENYTFRCSTDAMDRATANSHLEVVKFLHFNRMEGCTAKAMTSAATEHRFGIGVVQFLYEYRSEGDIVGAMKAAVTWGALEIVQYLHDKLPAGESAYFAVEAASLRYHAEHYTSVMEYLCANQQHERVGFLKQAVGNEAEDIVQTVM